MGLVSQEHCFICNTKVTIEDENSMERHNKEIHEDDLKRIRFSNSMKDVVRTSCKLCSQPFPLSRMRSHTKSVHGMAVSEYKKTFNIASDRDYDLVEVILHKCGICGLNLLLCSDVIAVHIKRHKITHANYNATFMNLMQKAPVIDNRKVESKKNPFIKPEGASVAVVPFSPSMLLSGQDTFQLDLSNLSADSLGSLFSPVPTEKGTMSTLNEDSFNTTPPDISDDDAIDDDAAIEDLESDIDRIMFQKSKKIKLSLESPRTTMMEKSDGTMNFHEKLKQKLSRIPKQEPVTHQPDPASRDNFEDKLKQKFPRLQKPQPQPVSHKDTMFSDDYLEERDPLAMDDVDSGLESEHVSGVDNSSEFSDLMSRIMGNFAGPSDAREHVTVSHSAKPDKSLDELIENIWE